MRRSRFFVRLVLAAALLPPATPGRNSCAEFSRQADDPAAFGTLPARSTIVRIGLSTGREQIVISSQDRFGVTDPTTDRPVWKESWRERLMVGIRGARPTEGRVYRAQVGSFDTREAAEGLAGQLRAELGEPVVVAWVPDRKVWRVRAGAGGSREELAPVMGRLRAAGHADAWITEEAIPQEGTSALVLVDGNYETREVPGRVLRVTPGDPDSLLSVDGKVYRGSFEVRLDVSGGIRVVNVLPLESYLRGVVPAELGPAQYPEVEALKAQAIAARTYTVRNLGQFAAEGFDICDTPRCQVYEGVKAEHPLSDRAIRETEGEIATWSEAPIDALYTSTCGGHTEDASEIFPEQAAPYLAGVPCAPEAKSRKQRSILLSGTEALVRAAAGAGEAAAILRVEDLIPASAIEAEALDAPLAPGEAEAWIRTLAERCGGARGDGAGRDGNGAGSSAGPPPHAGRAPDTEVPAGRSGRGDADGSAQAHGQRSSGSPSPGPGSVPTNPGRQSGGLIANGSSLREAPPVLSASGRLASVAAFLIQSLGWGERAALLVEREGAESWLPEDDPPPEGPEATAVAFFLREKAWPESATGRPDPNRTATRADLARLMLHAARSCDLLALDDAIVRGGDTEALRLSNREGRSSKRLDSAVYLFADFGAGPVPVRRARLVVGDKVRCHTGPDGRIDYLLVLPGRQGVSDDRYSAVSSWQVAYGADDLSERLQGYVGAGAVKDLVAVKRGVSGRVTELRVVGAEGQAVIRGFSIRTALGLKENLFTMNRQWSRSGTLRRVVFTGRGWGHGVGLCQVGAYGMALRGASYTEILKHYYTGIVLTRLPGSA